MESEDDDEDEVFRPVANSSRKGRAVKRRRVSVEDSDDEFGFDDATQAAMSEAGTYDVDPSQTGTD